MNRNLLLLSLLFSFFRMSLNTFKTVIIVLLLLYVFILFMNYMLMVRNHITLILILYSFIRILYLFLNSTIYFIIRYHHSTKSIIVTKLFFICNHFKMVHIILILITLDQYHLHYILIKYCPSLNIIG
jgi:hypothetical protein